MITHGDSALLIDEAESATEVPRPGRWDLDVDGSFHEMAAKLRLDQARHGCKRYVVLSMATGNRWLVWRANANTKTSQSKLP